MNRTRTLFPALALLLLAGCVTKTIEEEHPPMLIIAQNSDGAVTMQWESETDYVYTVYYQKTPASDWVILQKASRLPGTGQTMTAHDRTNPRNPPRRYRVLPEKP